MSQASLKTTFTEWSNIPWAKVRRKVFKLQKAIYQAVKSDNKAKARRLQKILHKSYYAKLLAVKQVTQDNTGKKTAGVDGQKSLTPKQRLNLVNEMSEHYKAKRLRRVWIPKPGRNEQRPLGIPTLRDRAMQALVKMVLEPYWEAQFEGESYGFRPGKSAQDAMQRIHVIMSKTPSYVLDADIEKCFDKINHEHLLSKLDCPANIRREIKQWLNAGVLDNGVFTETESGTPQGGVISPLLANIALDGMIRDIQEIFPNQKNYIQGYKPKIIRYADDFVVIHRELEVILQCKKAIQEWLKPVGLKLKEEKTRICHTSKQIEINGKKEKPGFDFLGFNIRQYPTGKHHAGKVVTPRLVRILETKTLIKPSDKAIKAHQEEIKKVVNQYRTAPQSALISRLNPIIRGWCNYYKSVASKDIFASLDHYMWKVLRAWTVSRTGRASYKKLRKYYSHGKYGAWTFQTEEGIILHKYRETKITRHPLVRSEASPYNGDWIYWSKRRGNYIGTPTRIAKLLLQGGKCNYCGQYFHENDNIEIDHITPKSLGGKDEYKNLQLLHNHCHDHKTARDGSLKPKFNGHKLPLNYRWVKDMLILVNEDCACDNQVS
ncbi:MAG: group II intron reverse transcriptase/maturase [Okeania sp. SIO2D1]|nr:group II intron reverse transcriptase/maturase [Okeania sp. SIO2D1]